MIYVATAHFGSPRWAWIQSRYLERNLAEPYRVYASFEGIDAALAPQFTKVFRHRGSHPGKLNLLAAEICADAEPDDLIMFLDGDAFPISDPMPLVRAGLARTPVIALQRLENLGDPQPHPAFCVMSAATWRILGGDWSEGYTWTNQRGDCTTDVGGNLLRLLELHGTDWTPMHRTNTWNPHPLWFGVYEDAIYHHGAGFRNRYSRLDDLSRPRQLQASRLPQGPRQLAQYINLARRLVWYSRLDARGTRLSSQIITSIEEDFDFYRIFLR